MGKIHESVKTGNIRLVREILLGNPRQIFDKNEEGKTPKELAQERNFHDIIALFRRTEDALVPPKPVSRNSSPNNASSKEPDYLHYFLLERGLFYLIRIGKGIALAAFVIGIAVFIQEVFTRRALFLKEKAAKEKHKPLQESVINALNMVILKREVASIATEPLFTDNFAGEGGFKNPPLVYGSLGEFLSVVPLVFSFLQNREQWTHDAFPFIRDGPGIWVKNLGEFYGKSFVPEDWAFSPEQFFPIVPLIRFLGQCGEQLTRDALPFIHSGSGIWVKSLAQFYGESLIPQTLVEEFF